MAWRNGQYTIRETNQKKLNRKLQMNPLEALNWMCTYYTMLPDSVLFSDMENFGVFVELCKIDSEIIKETMSSGAGLGDLIEQLKGTLISMCPGGLPPELL